MGNHGGAKGTSEGHHREAHSGRTSRQDPRVQKVDDRLARIAKEAKDPKTRHRRYNNLVWMVQEATLEESFYQLKKKAAVGVDRVTWEAYEARLEENIGRLYRRMKSMGYWPKPLRRAYIPKGNGKKRSLGIPTVEDKIVQHVFAKILMAIYEGLFVDESHGYRPKRGCHTALKAVDRHMRDRRTNWVIDADIKGFFDNVDHDVMMRMLEKRISDWRFLEYIRRMLKSGVMEEGEVRGTEKGTPQGGIISPVLANIYLHYGLDLWLKWIEEKVKGKVAHVRYADDFVIFVEREETVEWLREALRKRMKAIKLEISEEKTKVVETGPRAYERWKRGGGRKPGVFQFLGFDVYCTTTKRGRYRPGMRTSGKRFRRSLKRCKEWLKKHRSEPIKEIWRKLTVMLKGYYNYYGINGNYDRIRKFLRAVKRLIYKWLNRRSQKKTWKRYEEFARYLERYPLPKPRIVVQIWS